MGVQKKKVAVIGGGPAGMEAALTTARYGCEVTLITGSHPGDWKMTGTATWLQAIASLSPYDGIESLSPRRINEAAQDVIRRSRVSAAEQGFRGGAAARGWRGRSIRASPLPVRASLDGCKGAGGASGHPCRSHLYRQWCPAVLPRSDEARREANLLLSDPYGHGAASRIYRRHR